MDKTYDEAEELALQDMLSWMHRLTGVGRTELYRTASLVGDMAVTQAVNGRKGVHLMMPKSVMDGMVEAGVGAGGGDLKSKARSVRLRARSTSDPHHTRPSCCVGGIDPCVLWRSKASLRFNPRNFRPHLRREAVSWVVSKMPLNVGHLPVD